MIEVRLPANAEIKIKAGELRHLQIKRGEFEKVAEHRLEIIQNMRKRLDELEERDARLLPQIKELEELNRERLERMLDLRDRNRALTEEVKKWKSKAWGNEKEDVTE